MSLNYDYIVEKLVAAQQNGQFGTNTLACLDFGCGAGQIIEKGRNAGLNIIGADAYPEGHDAKFHDMKENSPHLAPHIHKIKKGQLPFADESFDVVTSNMVFEHIENVRQPLEEICRILKPGGLFLCLFPTAECLWEGHANLYFVHKLRPNSKAQYNALKLGRRFGLTNKGKDQSPEEWAKNFQDYLNSYVFYHKPSNINDLLRNLFGQAPARWEGDYMMFRLRRSRLKSLAPLFDNKIGRIALSFICRKRATSVFAVYNKSTT